MSTKTLILDKKAIHQKVRRIAYQIAEDFYDENEIHLIGIKGGGEIMAAQLKTILEEIEISSEIFQHELNIDKENPVETELTLSTDLTSLENKTIILIDDVCNSGKTIFYGYKSLLPISIKALKIAVLINRKHKRFPIECNYVGMSLATTLQEHIDVEVQNNQTTSAYLS